MTDAREAAARALCVARGLDPETLFDRLLNDDFPVDFVDIRGREFFYAWRKQVPYADAAIAAYISTAAPADVEAVCARLDAAASEREQVCLDLDIDPRTDAALNALIDAATLIRTQAAQLAEAKREIERVTNNRDMWRGQCDRQAGTLLEVRGDLEAAEAESARLREALTWYAEQAAGCRKLGPDGDKARALLNDDGGTRARAALNGGK